MPARHGFTAGVVTLTAATEADWLVLGGDWGAPANWSIDAVPGINDDVVISGSSDNGWTVFETNESALSLTLDMNSGTLEATGLTVAGTLTQTLGTLLVDPETEVSVGALSQIDGTVILDDEGTGTTTLDSGGVDSVNGQVTLMNGAVWLDSALGIGLGLLNSSDQVSSSVTLAGGSAPSQLVTAGQLQLGGDPTTDAAGGIGSLEVDNGSVVFVAGLSVFNGSAISVDVNSFVDVGGSTAPLPGAISVNVGAEVLADIALLDADVVSDGTLAVVPWVVPGLTAPGDVEITGSLLSTGLVTVDALATLSVDGSIELDAGSLTVSSGGTLAAANVASDGIGVYLAGGALTLDNAVLNSFGTADFANSNATLLEAAVWSTSTLSIGPGFSDGTTANATVSLDGGSTLFSSNGLDLGNDPVAGAGGGVGTLDLTAASTVEASSVALLNGSLLSLDGTSTVMLGSAAAEAGTVVVAVDGLLVGDIAAIGGNVDDAGTFDVVSWTGSDPNAPGNFLVSGSLIGAGAVLVDGTLEVGDASGFTGTVAIDGGGQLILDSGDMAGALLSAVGGTASIDVMGQSFDSTGFFPTYDVNTGLLVFGDATSQSTLEFAPGLALDDFSLSTDAAGTGTLITEAACFAAGTRIATECGDAMVQHLCVGDRVRLAEGGSAPVVWLGHRRVACRRHPRPADVRPVRITAHAFGLDRPRRDLLVSPDHAVFVDGVLIPVRYLLNDATVRQEAVASVTYWHVELPAHAALLAEGLPAESYLDTGNRSAFANGGGVVQAHPEFARSVWERRGFAPLVTEGPARDLVYRRLLAQAFALGWRLRCAGPVSEWVAPTERVRIGLTASRQARSRF